MRPLVTWVVVTLALNNLRGALSDGDMFCSCSFWHQRNITFALYCSKNQVVDKGFSCKKATVPEIPPGYQYVPGYALVRLYRAFQTWPAAKMTCETEGSRLAFPPDRHAVDGLTRIFAQEKNVWYGFIGVSDESSEGVFVGVDGRPAPYLNWQPNEPNDHVGKENCVTVRNDGLMNDLPCDWPSPFFCERPLRAGVPDAYHWLGDAGRFYRVHEERRTRAKAALVCRAENATLAVTDTWQRVEALLGLMWAASDYYFIGFHDQQVEGDFVTDKGRHLDDMEFRVWAPSQPNNNDAGQEEDCLALSGRGYYNDVRCDLELPFVCEIAPTW